MLQRGQQCPESPEGSRDSLLVVGRRWGTAQTVGNSTERGESEVRGGSLWFRQAAGFCHLIVWPEYATSLFRGCALIYTLGGVQVID